MSKVKKIAISCLSVVLILCTVIALTNLSRYNTTFADGLFETSPHYTVETNKSNELSEDGKSGLKITTKVNNQILKFKNSMSGKFEVAFRPISLTEGGYNFTEVSFIIRSEDSRYGLKLNFKETSTTEGTFSPKYGVSLTLPEICYGRSKSVASTSSFTNVGDIAVLGFDPDTMETYGYNGDKKVSLLDLDDKYQMSGISTNLIYTGFTTYNVEMIVSGITGDSASLILYSVNGQELSGETFTNTAGAIVSGVPSISNGVINKEYKIADDAIVTYDVLDGFSETFNGNIKATSPSGKTVDLVDGKFTPDEEGEYILEFIPKDTEGVTRLSKKVAIKVFGSMPETTINTAYPLENRKVGVGSTVKFPMAESYSQLNLHNANSKVNLIIKQDEQVIATFDATVDNAYTFDKVGDYTAVYATESLYGQQFEVVSNIVVDGAAPVFELEEKLQALYALDTVLPLPNSTVSGSKLWAERKVYFPDGRLTTAGVVCLDVEGCYKVEYSAKVNGIEYSHFEYFNVKQESASLWTNVKGVNTDYSVAPAYSAELYEGVLLTANRSSATARYTNLIDLSDNGKEDTLLEFIPVPVENSEPEFSVMYVTLVDAYDENNKITIKIEKDDYSDHYVVYVSVCANKEGIFTTSKSIRGSFYGSYTSRWWGIYPAISTSLYFDYATLTIYGSIKNNSSEYYQEFVKLDDIKQVGQGNVWKGFTDGLVYLDITFDKVVSSGANLLILNVDGHKFDNKYVNDAIAPKIYVDFLGNDENELPVGVVDKNYSIFKAKSIDLVDGTKTNVEVQVYKYNSTFDRAKVNDINGEYFTPDSPGLYGIEYTAVDRQGNKTKKLVFVDVVSEIEQLGYEFDAFTFESEAGKRVVIPSGTVTGGSGKVNVDVKVAFGGKDVKLDNMAFTPKVSGDYDITVTLKDYVGNECVVNKTLKVVPANLPILVESTVPEAVLMGRTVQLAPWKAYDYSSGEEVEVEVKVSADGVELSKDLKWTPQNSGLSTIEFSATNANGTVRETRTVEVLDVNAEGVYLANYFKKENVEIEGNASKFTVVATQDNAGVAFVNPVLCEGFSLRLFVPADKNQYSALRVSLVDSVDVNAKLVFDITKNEDETASWSKFICGDVTKEIAGSFYGTSSTPLEINYDQTTQSIVDYAGNTVYIIEKAHNQSSWKGFTSGKLYVKIQLIGVEGASAFDLMSISNQTFSKNAKKDMIIPQIIAPEIATVSFGGTMVIKPAYAYDILSEVTKFTLTVYSPEGEKLLNAVDPTKEYEINVNQYGAYRIEYYVEDSAGVNNKYMPTTSIVNIYDVEKPVIKVKSLPVKTAKVGSEITIPKATVTDNATDDISLKVWIVEPSGFMVEVSGKYKIKCAGKHKLVYFASDDYGCTAMESFEIIVG